MALGEHPVADLEHLRVGLGALNRDGDQIGRVERLASDRAPLHERAHRLEPVAKDGGALELLGRCGLGHLGSGRARRYGNGRREGDDRVDPRRYPSRST